MVLTLGVLVLDAGIDISEAMVIRHAFAQEPEAQLPAVMRDRRYTSWRTALSSVFGIYLITDAQDGKQNVGRAGGDESIKQRWNSYAANGLGGNTALCTRNPSSFQFSLLRGFDPASPTRDIDAAESHFKDALLSRQHGLNRNSIKRAADRIPKKLRVPGRMR